MMRTISLGVIMTSTIKRTNWNCEFRPLAWDSEHFGISIGELSPLKSPDNAVVNDDDVRNGVALVQQVCSDAFKSGAKLIYASVSSADSLSQRALCKSDFVLMDSLVTHRLEFSSLKIQPQKSPNVRLATAADLPAIEQISAECFGDRTYNVNRLNSDPALDQTKVDQLYRLWMTNSVNGKLADEVFVYEENGKVLGFVTLKLPANDDASIPLNAVAVDSHGKGIYTKMVHHVVAHVKEKGAKAIEIKTQLPNVSVHKAWARMGAAVVDSVHRFHRSAPNG